MAGVLAGLIPILFINDLVSYYKFLAVYIFMCSIDIVSIINLLSLKKNQYKLNLLQIAREQLKEYEELK